MSFSPGNADNNGGDSHGSMGKLDPLHPPNRWGSCEKCVSPRRRLSDFSCRRHFALRFWNQTWKERRWTAFIRRCDTQIECLFPLFCSVRISIIFLSIPKNSQEIESASRGRWMRHTPRDQCLINPLNVQLNSLSQWMATSTAVCRARDYLWSLDQAVVGAVPVPVTRGEYCPHCVHCRHFGSTIINWHGSAV